jgi:HAD superfamily hydrolase (TIGR01509 family)
MAPAGQAVIFDLDGVLADTEGLKGEAHTATVRGLGGDAPASIYEQCMGRSHDAVERVFMKAGGVLAAQETYAATFSQIYAELLEQGVAAVPGSQSLLQRLTEFGYRLALVTSSRTWMTRRVLTKTGLDGFFEVIVTAADVTSAKPAPDCYRLALQRLHLTPDRAIALEDTEAGIEAASAAGLRVIGLRHRLNSRHRFDAACSVIDSLEDTDRVLAVIERSLTPC